MPVNWYISTVRGQALDRNRLAELTHGHGLTGELAKELEGMPYVPWWQSPTACPQNFPQMRLYISVNGSVNAVSRVLFTHARVYIWIPKFEWISGIDHQASRLLMNRALFKVNRDEWRGFGLFKFMNRLKLVYSNSWIELSWSIQIHE